MDIAVQHEHERPLLHRKDVIVRVAHQGATPGRQKVRDTLAHQLKADAALVVVRAINAEFGSASSIVDASVYKDKESLAKFERPYMAKRHGGAEKKEGDA